MYGEGVTTVTIRDWSVCSPSIGISIIGVCVCVCVCVAQPKLAKFLAIKINFQPKVLHNSYHLSNTIRVTKYMIGGRVACMEETRNTFF